MPDYTLVVPISAIESEGIAWIIEKIREYGSVTGLAIEVEAADSYELAMTMRDISDEISSSGYANAPVHIIRPKFKASAKK